MKPIHRILCPVDFSDTCALRAFAFAERLANSLSAEILLLHVSDSEPSYTVVGRHPASEPEAQHRLENIRPSVPSIPVERIVQFGNPGEVICWLAENKQCDLIVMGTHGRQGLLHLLMGSVAEYVMRHARCPVLTCREIPENVPPLKEPVELPVPVPRFM